MRRSDQLALPSTCIRAAGALQRSALDQAGNLAMAATMLENRGLKFRLRVCVPSPGAKLLLPLPAPTMHRSHPVRGMRQPKNESTVTTDNWNSSVSKMPDMAICAVLH